MGLGSWLKHAWTVFSVDTEQPVAYSIGPSSYARPDRPRFKMSSERTLIASIYTRMAIDISGVRMEHDKTDDNGMYSSTIYSGLNNCLNVEANIDQGARHFRYDMAMSLFNWGCIAIVPVDTTLDPRNSGNWDIKTMRVGEILQWYPQHVQVRVYNEQTGLKEDITVPKSTVAIVENPFYAVMNEPNSTLKRLVYKLSLLDNIDEIASQGKLDIILQLPYVVKSESRKNSAEKRIAAIQEQLRDSTYGIAYTDGTEKITQLNRPIENNLLEQVKYLQDELYNQLGLTPEVMNGTADDVAMNNYFNRTIEPIMDALTEAMSRTFLTKTARTQGQTVSYFQTPFKLIPISELADIVDALSRNQIVTPNEIRPAIGLKPSSQPQANQLINSNMPLSDQVTGPDATAGNSPDPEDQAAQDEAKLNKQMSDLGL